MPSLQGLLAQLQHDHQLATSTPTDDDLALVTREVATVETREFWNERDRRRRSAPSTFEGEVDLADEPPPGWARSGSR